MAVKQSSAQKRHRQSEERRLRNKSVRSSVRTSAKKARLAIEKKDKENATACLRSLIKELDTAAGKGIITKNAAARKKSRMQKFYNAVFAEEKNA